jgi:hypothetical protein
LKRFVSYIEVSTSDCSEIFGPPGWHLSSPGQTRNREDFTGAKTAAVVLVMVCPHEMAALRILIGEVVAALNVTQ